MFGDSYSRVTGLLTLLALVLTGCGDDGDQAATTTVAPTTTVVTATPEQVASEVAGPRQSWLDAYDTTSLDCLFLDEVCRSSTGVLGYFTLATSTETLSLTFDRVTDPDFQYGAVPEELAPLVEETADAVEALLPVANALVDGDCLYSPAPGCDDQNAEVMNLARQLETALTSWAPYV